jgi:glycosyltransferase involved in cell wall biosynthesis
MSIPKNSKASNQRALKILFVLGFPNPFAGAAWTRVSFFAEHLANEGSAVTVLGAFSYKTLRKRGFQQHSKMNLFNFIFNMNMNNPLIFAMNSLIAFLVTTLFVAIKKPNTAIISVPSGDVGLGALLACRFFRTKFMVDYRDEWEDREIDRAGNRISVSFFVKTKAFASHLYEKSMKIIAVTPNFIKNLHQRGLTQLVLIPNGADTRIFKPSKRKKGTTQFKIVYTGGIGGYYRLDEAIKAIRILSEDGLKNVTLIIVGEGEIRRILELASQMGISRKVVYEGIIRNSKQMAKQIAEADVGLIPYDDNILWKNSIPAKFFEYCACGIPVIATTYEDSLLAELIRKYRIGIISPPMDEEELSKVIYWMYKNKPFLEAAGNRARLLIEEEFDRNKTAEEFLNLIRVID